MGRRESWRLASLIFNVLLVMLALPALIGELFTPQFVNTLIVPGYLPSEQALMLPHTLSQHLIILSIPLATAGAGTTETLLLGLMLFFLLRTRVKADKGMQRLQRRRLSQVNNSS